MLLGRTAKGSGPRSFITPTPNQCPGDGGGESWTDSACIAEAGEEEKGGNGANGPAHGQSPRQDPLARVRWTTFNTGQSTPFTVRRSDSVPTTSRVHATQGQSDSWHRIHSVGKNQPFRGLRRLLVHRSGHREPAGFHDGAAEAPETGREAAHSRADQPSGARNVLPPVVMWTNNVAQVQGDQRLRDCVFSHWGTDGRKPKMRNSLAGGYRANGEHSTTFNECGLVDTCCQWKGEPMKMEGDAVEGCLHSPGHRETMPAPDYWKVNIGLAWDTHAFKAFQHFEGD